MADLKTRIAEIRLRIERLDVKLPQEKQSEETIQLCLTPMQALLDFWIELERKERGSK